jgi:hypothetical protein
MSHPRRGSDEVARNSANAIRAACHQFLLVDGRSRYGPDYGSLDRLTALGPEYVQLICIPHIVSLNIRNTQYINMYDHNTL